MEGLNTAFDDVTTSKFHLQGLTIIGIEGIEMLRQLAFWSRTVWYQKTLDELLPLDEEEPMRIFIGTGQDHRYVVGGRNILVGGEKRLGIPQSRSLARLEG